MATAQSPIVVLDSGIGGLTVVQALRDKLPHDDILYFGDTARLPYGNKSAQTVTTYVRQIINYFKAVNPKHVVIACNTATALTLPVVRGEFAELSISGVIEPGARAAVEAAGGRTQPVIGVIATEATVRSRAYECAIQRRRQWARILSQPTPLLVPIIEEGRDGRDPLVGLALRQYLEPLVARGMDVLLLGCTHYPLLKASIAQLVGPQMPVVDSADTCADDVARRLRNAGLMRTARAVDDPAQLICHVTDEPARFAQRASKILALTIEQAVWVPPETLHDVPAVAIRNVA